MPLASRFLATTDVTHFWSCFGVLGDPLLTQTGAMVNPFHISQLIIFVTRIIFTFMPIFQSTCSVCNLYIFPSLDFELLHFTQTYF